MRDPQRIDRTMESLRALWHQQPDSRLGQLIVNIARPLPVAMDARCQHIFSLEDDEWQKRIAKLLACDTD